MKTILLLILAAFTASAATLYPVMSDNTNRTITGGTTNLALLNGTNTFTGPITATASGVAVDITAGSLRSFSAIRANFLNTYDNGSSIIANPVDYVQIYSGSGGNAIRILSGGDVGVGTTTPSQKLTVNGVTAMLATSAPTPAAGSAYIYSKTSGTTEMWVMDSAGNETQISPHARATSPAPASVDAGDKTPIVIHHRNLFTGEQEWLHLSAMARKLEQLTGKKFVFRAAMDPADVKDWASVQEAERANLEAEHSAALSAWLANTNPAKGPRPTKRALRTEEKPAFLP